MQASSRVSFKKDAEGASVSLDCVPASRVEIANRVSDALLSLHLIKLRCMTVDEYVKVPCRATLLKMIGHFGSTAARGEVSFIKSLENLREVECIGYDEIFMPHIPPLKLLKVRGKLLNQCQGGQVGKTSTCCANVYTERLAGGSKKTQLQGAHGERFMPNVSQSANFVYQ